MIRSKKIDGVRTKGLDPIVKRVGARSLEAGSNEINLMGSRAQAPSCTKHTDQSERRSEEATNFLRLGVFNMLAQAFAITIIPMPKANSGYYIGLTGQLNRQSLRVKSDKFDLHQLEKKSTRCGADLVMGYAYCSKLAIAGQVLVGYGGQDIKHAVDVTNTSAEKARLISDVSLRNRVRCATEVLLGFTIGNTIRTFPYVIIGGAIEFTQVRGSMFSEQDAKKSVVYFGKDSATVQGVQMPAIRSQLKLVPTPVFGLGTRLYLLGRMFVGVEARYFAKTKRELNTRCARIDPTGTFGPAYTSITTGDTKFPGRLAHYSVGITVGVHL
ncbi:MAG: hypothetical protein LBJ89_01630 [Holosporales bacterium]|jgi:hypothetical protein|nr:hypothetical protein [Holosporales bacterium]